MKEDLGCVVQQRSNIHDEGVGHASNGERGNMPWCDGGEDVQKYFDGVQHIEREENDDIEE